ncbi:MAG: GGDEF domain-containing protein [Acidimicrobiales bacterium]
MHFKTSPTERLVRRVLLQIGITYVLAAIFIASSALFRPRLYSPPDLVAASAIAAIVLASNIHDLAVLRRRQYLRFRACVVLSQACAGIVALSLFVRAVGDHHGAFGLLVLLPLVAIALIGDYAMVAITWAVMVPALVLALGGQIHPPETLAWTVALYSLAAGGLAVIIDHAMRGTIRNAKVNHAMAELAAKTGEVSDWPGGVQPLAGMITEALDTERFAILIKVASPPGTASILTWPPDASWPGWDAVESLAATALDAECTGSPGDAAGSHREADLTRPTKQTRSTTRTTHALTSEDLVAATARAGDLAVAIVVPKRSPTSPLDQEMLGRTVAGLLAAMATRSDLVNRLMELANTDELTGLPNRRKLFEVLDNEVERVRRSGKPLGVAMLDLDEFKAFNDLYGHVEGDSLLRRFAESIAARIRAQDTCARYGGEEFMHVLPDTDANGVAQLLHEVAALSLEGPNHSAVTFSAGVATWDRHESVDRLISRADDALYEAKRAGRNRIVAAALEPTAGTDDRQ